MTAMACRPNSVVIRNTPPSSTPALAYTPPSDAQPDPPAVLAVRFEVAEADAGGMEVVLVNESAKTVATSFVRAHDLTRPMVNVRCGNTNNYAMTYVVRPQTRSPPLFMLPKGEQSVRVTSTLNVIPNLEERYLVHVDMTANDEGITLGNTVVRRGHAPSEQRDLLFEPAVADAIILGVPYEDRPWKHADASRGDVQVQYIHGPAQPLWLYNGTSTDIEPVYADGFRIELRRVLGELGPPIDMTDAVGCGPGRLEKTPLKPHMARELHDRCALIPQDIPAGNYVATVKYRAGNEVRKSSTSFPTHDLSYIDLDTDFYLRTLASRRTQRCLEKAMPTTPRGAIEALRPDLFAYAAGPAQAWSMLHANVHQVAQFEVMTHALAELPEGPKLLDEALVRGDGPPSLSTRDRRAAIVAAMLDTPLDNRAHVARSLTREPRASGLRAFVQTNALWTYRSINALLGVIEAAPDDATTRALLTTIHDMRFLRFASEGLHETVTFKRLAQSLPEPARTKFIAALAPHSREVSTFDRRRERRQVPLDCPQARLAVDMLHKAHSRRSAPLAQ